jgi:hypothetical protein
MGTGKKNRTLKDDQVKITLDFKTTERVTPAWHRLWRILLSPGPGSTVKGGIRHEQSTGAEQDAEEAGEAKPQEYF